MKKSIILLPSMPLIFSRSACGDSFKQGMKDGMQSTTQESTVASGGKTKMNLCMRNISVVSAGLDK